MFALGCTCEAMVFDCWPHSWPSDVPLQRQREPFPPDQSLRWSSHNQSFLLATIIAIISWRPIISFSHSLLKNCFTALDNGSQKQISYLVWSLFTWFLSVLSKSMCIRKNKTRQLLAEKAPKACHTTSSDWAKMGYCIFKLVHTIKRSYTARVRVDCAV